MEFTFWKNNRTDQEYKLSPEQFQTKFMEWLWTKELNWLDYYSRIVIRAFITSDPGLQSVFDEKQYNKMEDLVREAFNDWMTAMEKLVPILKDMAKNEPAKLSLWALAITQCREDKELIEIIKTLANEYIDNPVEMERVFGKEASGYIKKLLPGV